MPNQFNPHAKILKDGDYYIDNSHFVLSAPRVFKKTKEQQIDEATQRIRELNEEIKRLEKELNEKLEMARSDADELIQKAEKEAENIVNQAEKNAFERIKKSLEEKDGIVLQTKEEVKKIIEEAEQEKQRILNSAFEEAKKIKEDAYREGYEVGKNEGFESGRAELLSMIDRLKSIIHLTLQERERILVHSERQILNLVLTMVKKIVKKLTHEEENVVIENVKEALSIIRGAMKVYIHVNPLDYEYTTRFKDEFIKLIEGMPEIKIFEDPTVDRGGVYIETDLGEIDARISTQLEEIEDKIKFYIPVKVKGKDIESSEVEKTEEVSVNTEEIKNE
ncbi:MAG: flagellar assembly protein FliH [Brevinematales bacterium]